ncbi:MAG: ABC-2 transporter permease [Clostridia bacterium]
MKNLFYKECRLAAHPTSILFLLLSAMLLIPNYPYLVVFFYTSLAIFFVCLAGRENHDIFYTLSLPVAKRDIVRARFAFSVVLQLAQILIAVPFAVIRSRYSAPMRANSAGLDANVALFGFAFILLGLFNLTFFTAYYKKPDKVGFAFVCATSATMLFMLAVEASVQIVPFMRDRIDTIDPSFLPQKLLLLLVGLLLYALCTGLALRKAEKSFEALDL